MSVAETEGDTPLAVFISPWTIQGCRPLSVSIQPAVFIRNGTMTAHGRDAEEPLGVLEFLAGTSSQPPQSANSMTRVAR